MIFLKDVISSRTKDGSILHRDDATENGQENCPALK
jgi:hypothetical protein